MQVTVSVVVPIYNMEKLLPRCMDALFKQTSDDFEIVLVDDGSKDGSPAMCDAYAEQYPELVRVVHKPNGGLSSARNAGIDAAKGKFVIFPDPDDWVEPEYVSRLIELQSCSNAELCCVGYFIDYDDRSIPAELGGEVYELSAEKAQRSLILSPCMGGFAWNKLYNLDVIRKHDLRFLDDVGTTEDMDFAYRFLEHSKKACFDPESRLYHYYQRRGAATGRGFSVKKLDAVKTYEKIIMSTNQPELALAAKEEICNTAVNLIPEYLRSDADMPEIYGRIRGYIKTYFSDYMKSSRFGAGRKLQAVLARFTPHIFKAVKDKFSRG